MTFRLFRLKCQISSVVLLGKILKESLQDFSDFKHTLQHPEELSIFLNYRRFVPRRLCDVITTRVHPKPSSCNRRFANPSILPPKISTKNSNCKNRHQNQAFSAWLSNKIQEILYGLLKASMKNHTTEFFLFFLDAPNLSFSNKPLKSHQYTPLLLVLLYIDTKEFIIVRELCAILFFLI